MVNKAAKRLTNPLAIGAAFHTRSHMMFSGFISLQGMRQDEDDEILHAVRVIRRSGGRYLTPEQYALVAAPEQLRGHYRFATLEYTHLPYTQLRFEPSAALMNEHFLHVDPADEQKVRYFASREHMKQDRHTTSTLGRYIGQFYNDVYSEAEARDIAACFTSGSRRLNIKFLTSATDIEMAYTSGPQSCMRYSRDHFRLPMHPSAVYADSDLSLAILIDANERITARGLVWRDQMRFNRLYGDTVALKFGLAARGFRHGDFDGAKIKRIEHRGALIMPYIDAYNPECFASSNGAAYIEDNTEHITIVDDGEERNDQLRAGTTGGLIDIPPAYRCDSCGAACDSTTEVANNDNVCDSCLSHFRQVVGEGYRYQSELNSDFALRLPERDYVRLGTTAAEGLVPLSEEYYEPTRRGALAHAYEGDVVSIYDTQGNTHVVRQVDTNVTHPIHIGSVHIPTERVHLHSLCLTLNTTQRGSFSAQSYRVHLRHRDQLIALGGVARQNGLVIDLMLPVPQPTNEVGATP